MVEYHSSALLDTTGKIKYNCLRCLHPINIGKYTLQKGMVPAMKKFMRNLLFTLGALTLAVALTGCGGSAEEEDDFADNVTDSSVPRKDSGEKPEKPDIGINREEMVNSGDSQKEAPDLEYLESMMIENYYGDKEEYQVYVPKGSSYEDGSVYYFDSGLDFYAHVLDCVSEEYIRDFLADSLSFETDTWLEQTSWYTDVEISEITESGHNIYQFASAAQKDIYDIPYRIMHLCYMDVKENGIVVLWNLELRECSMDETAEQILGELAECYGLNPEELKPESGWAEANAERIQTAEAKDSLPPTVLWFNATYAPLTQSNKGIGTNWKLVGGMKATESNAELCRDALSRDWSIEDAASALETVEHLKEAGHREICRQYVKELEDMGILDADENTFLEELQASGKEENLARYVIVYYMYQNGLRADDIAAWDLCRVNQLYGDFYICGYMTYEEAMDASLENSLILQEMYSSWADLVSAYMLGYQFWRGDLMMTEDSPTLQRYQSYLELLEMEDGPYTLDWNMTLEKSW